MTRVQFTAFIFSLGFSTVSAQPNPEFQEVIEFTINGLDSISEIVYNDIDNDDTAEALIRSGPEVILYSVSEGSVLWETTLDTGFFYRVLLADVNGLCQDRKGS